MTSGLLNPTHIILLLLVVLIVLGPKRLPHAGRSLGRGMREFRDGLTNGHDSPVETPGDTSPAAPTGTTTSTNEPPR
jgi:sec-independent protein translocase protein TatA